MFKINKMGIYFLNQLPLLIKNKLNQCNQCNHRHLIFYKNDKQEMFLTDIWFLSIM